MTVPTLMQNHQRKTYVIQLYKVYNEITQAALQYQTDRNAVNLREAGINSTDSSIAFIRNYFKIVKECDGLSGCFADSYKKMNGAEVSLGNTRSFVLANGASVRPLYNAVGLALISVLVDVNGAKGPNIAGRDLFIMCLYINGVLDDASFIRDDDGNVSEIFSAVPLSEDERNKVFNSECNSDSTGVAGCFGKILNDNWEMTY